MSGRILDGKLLAQTIKDQLKKDIASIKDYTGQRPQIVNIMIGDDPGAKSYANSQKKTAEFIGLTYHLETLPATSSQAQIERLIGQLNSDSSIHGILIYKPVPASIDYHSLVNQIDPRKDLEGINETNMGRMLLGENKIIPCTPAAVMEHISSTGVSCRGKEAVVVGRSEIVGKPLALLLLEQQATVTICHSGTSAAGKLAEHVKRADILVAAVGKPKFIPGDWIKEGAIVIDVGINKVGDKLVGDVDYEQAVNKAAFITPVPGGVGPVTAVMLMKNCLQAFQLQTHHKKENIKI